MRVARLGLPGMTCSQAFVRTIVRAQGQDTLGLMFLCRRIGLRYVEYLPLPRARQAPSAFTKPPVRVQLSRRWAYFSAAGTRVAPVAAEADPAVTSASSMATTVA